MADIREILAAISDDDRAMYTQHRTEMRRSYMVAHNQTVGMDKWTETDDQFLDYIDIMLAVLYDRAGRLMTTKDILGDDKRRIILRRLTLLLSMMAGLMVELRSNESIKSQASLLRRS